MMSIRIVVATAFLSVLSACVSQEQFDMLQGQYNESQSANQTLTEQNASMQQDVERLREELTDINRRHLDVLATVGQIRNTENGLRKQLEVDKKIIKDTEAERTALMAERKKLSRTLEDREKQRKSWEKQLAEKDRALKLLQNRVQRLEAQLAQAKNATSVRRPASRPTTQPTSRPRAGGR